MLFLKHKSATTTSQFDPETGLYYYRARYYDPGIGRFLQTDPIGYWGGMNLYSYCGNDPVNWVDPFGWCKDKPWWEDVGDWFMPDVYAGEFTDPTPQEPVNETSETEGTFPWFPKKTPWKDIKGPYDKSIHITATFSGTTGTIGRSDWRVLAKFVQERYVTHRRIYFDRPTWRFRIIELTTTRQTRIIEQLIERGRGPATRWDTPVGQVWFGEGGPAGPVGGIIE